MTRLFGHAEAVAAFRDALDSGRLHHAWLISGPRGVGKATFARAAALRLLAQASGPQPRAPGLDVEPDHPAARLFAAGSHPDFRLVEREAWDKNSPPRIIPKHERSGSEELARSIRIAQIRALNASLGRTTSMSSRRAIVIDAADDLEPSAANALLKSLEEPPASTTFLLVSHAPERLLPTIRSRCRSLRLSSLSEGAMRDALAALVPDADAAELDALAGAGQGAPGRALAFRGLDIDGLDRAMGEIADQGDPYNQRRLALAQGLSAKSAQSRYEAFLARAPSLIATRARRRRGPELAHALRLWEQATALAAVAVRQSLEPQATTFEMCGLLAQLSEVARRAA